MLATKHIKRLRCGQVGERKPQQGPFQEAVKRAGYASANAVGGEWVHVGDDWASDCVGAKVHGGSIVYSIQLSTQTNMDFFYVFRRLTCSRAPVFFGREYFPA